MVIELTDEAIKKLLEKTSDNKHIKIGVKASGCNGFKYLFDYLNGDPKEDDIEMNDIAIFTAISKTIKKAIKEVHKKNKTKTNISKTALEIALKQLL